MTGPKTAHENKQQTRDLSLAAQVISPIRVIIFDVLFKKMETMIHLR